MERNLLLIEGSLPFHIIKTFNLRTSITCNDVFVVKITAAMNKSQADSPFFDETYINNLMSNNFYTQGMRCFVLAQHGVIHLMSFFIK